MHTLNNPNLKSYRQKLRNNMTKAEILLWSKLRKRQILNYKFRRQYSVGMFILDFYCPKLKLAIEVDGGHHADKKVKEYDNIRTKYLNDNNIKVLRYWNNEVINNLSGVCMDIESNIRRINAPTILRRGHD